MDNNVINKDALFMSVSIDGDTIHTGGILPPVSRKWIEALAFDPELLDANCTDESREFFHLYIPALYEVVMEKRGLYASLGFSNG
jgi:hypothetical protein